MCSLDSGGSGQLNQLHSAVDAGIRTVVAILQHLRPRNCQPRGLNLAVKPSWPSLRSRVVVSWRGWWEHVPEITRNIGIGDCIDPHAHEARSGKCISQCVCVLLRKAWCWGSRGTDFRKFLDLSHLRSELPGVSANMPAREGISGKRDVCDHFNKPNDTLVTEFDLRGRGRLYFSPRT